MRSIPVYLRAGSEGNSSTLRRRSPREGPRPRDKSGQTRTPAAPGTPRSPMPADDTAYGGVGLERGRVDGHRPPLQQTGRREALLHPREDRAMRLQRNQPPRPRQGRMIRCRRVEAEPDELAHGQRVRGAPRDPALGVEPFEVTDQQASGSTARAADSAAPSPARRTADIPFPRTGRSSPRRGRHSAWRRTDGPARLAARRSAPTSVSARSCVCPCHGRSVRGQPLWAVLLSPTFTTGC